jgi:hypothetical protein
MYMYVLMVIGVGTGVGGWVGAVYTCMIIYNHMRNPLTTSQNTISNSRKILVKQHSFSPTPPTK